jgi:hypothetical protein
MRTFISLNLSVKCYTRYAVPKGTESILHVNEIPLLFQSQINSEFLILLL